MSRFGMFGKLTARPGQRHLLVERLLEAARLMESAEGCELYVVSTSLTEADAVWVMEIWRSVEDHDASLSMEGVRPLIQRTLPLIAVPPEQIRVAPIGGRGLAAR